MNSCARVCAFARSLNQDAPGRRAQVALRAPLAQVALAIAAPLAARGRERLGEASVGLQRREARALEVMLALDRELAAAYEVMSSKDLELSASLEAGRTAVAEAAAMFATADEADDTIVTEVDEAESKKGILSLFYIFLLSKKS